MGTNYTVLTPNSTPRSLASYLPLDGGTMTGSLGIGSAAGTYERLNLTGTDSSGNGVNLVLKNTSTDPNSFAVLKMITGSGSDGGLMFGSNQSLYGYGIGNGITFRAGTSSQEIAFSTGTGVHSGTGTPALIIKSSTLIGVNETSPAAQFHIVPNAAATKGILIKGAASQTANLTEWQDSSGTVLAKVESDGGFVMGRTLRLKNYTVATLPAGTQGDTAFVTDALAPAFLAALLCGGAVVTTVFYDGANWIVQ